MLPLFLFLLAVSSTCLIGFKFIYMVLFDDYVENPMNIPFSPSLFSVLPPYSGIVGDIVTSLQLLFTIRLLQPVSTTLNLS